MVEQVLVITFPEDHEDHNHDHDSSYSYSSTPYDPPTTLPSAVAVPTVTLPVKGLTGMLQTFCKWSNDKYKQTQQDTEESLPPTIHYECKDFSYQEFISVQHILTRSYHCLHVQEMKQSKECLDYFGPFDIHDILLHLSVSNATTVCTTNDSSQDKSNEHHDVDKDIILCETEEQMKILQDVAQIFNEPTYVPFKMLLTEGIIYDQHSDQIHTLSTTMPILLLGDYNNIFSLWRVVQPGGSTFQPLPSIGLVHSRNQWQPMNDYKVGVEYDFHDFNHSHDDFGHRCDIEGCSYGLKIGLGEKMKLSDLALYLFEDFTGGFRSLPVQYLPGVIENEEEEEEKLESTISLSFKQTDNAIASMQQPPQSSSSSLFHRNEENKIAFTKIEAQKACDYISSMNFENRVKAHLELKRFELKESHSGVAGYRESTDNVYGYANTLWVCGVVRLDDNCSPINEKLQQGPGNPNKSFSCDDTPFNIWPSKDAKDKMAKRRQEYEDLRSTDWDFEDWEEIYFQDKETAWGTPEGGWGDD